MASSQDPVGVFWDLENCSLPCSNLRDTPGEYTVHDEQEPVMLAERVASNVRDFAMRYGRVVAFNAYSDPHGSGVPPDSRLALQQSGVRLMDIPNHRKEAADKAIIVDFCLFAVEYKAPATIIIISTGDRDFANAPQRLYQLGYKVVVSSITVNGAVPAALRYAREKISVFDWQSLALTGPLAVQLPANSEQAEADLQPPPSAEDSRTGAVDACSQANTEVSGCKTWSDVVAASTSSMDSAEAQQTCKTKQRKSPRLASAAFIPHGCVTAIKAFWQSNPEVVAVQHPYTQFTSFLKRHPKCSGGYRRYGYSKLKHFLMDAQAAKLLWLRPGSTVNPATGTPFEEIAPPPARAEYYNPTRPIYWLALGFTQEEAAQYSALVSCRAFSANAVVAKLARNSPHFDSDLHASWYFEKVGDAAFAVRAHSQAKSKAAARGLSVGAAQPPAPSCKPADADQSSDVSTHSLFPPECQKAVTDFWEEHGRQPVQSPYTEFVAFLNYHSNCGGYKVWGYSKLTHFLRDAQAVGLLWLRPGKKYDHVKGQPFPEIAPTPTGAYSNPSHALYWLALGFSQQEAQSYLRATERNDWSDDVVARLASSSPQYDPELKAMWYYDKVGHESWAVRAGIRASRSATESTDEHSTKTSAYSHVSPLASKRGRQIYSMDLLLSYKDKCTKPPDGLLKEIMPHAGQLSEPFEPSSTPRSSGCAEDFQHAAGLPAQPSKMERDRDKPCAIC